ncbi:hypothetical protein JL722_9335 [Aureococcus anophagefferens]|nr:hypothetical protein JL722_9335 [Aureococcus anophagefferens]
MPKPTESMDVNQYTRHKSYAYHNNLHHDAHRSTGPVLSEFLTLSPLMMKGAVVSKKAYGSRKYSGVEGSTKLDMKLVNSAKDEVARALETTANICLEEMKTAEEQGVKARGGRAAVARKVKEKALAASDSRSASTRRCWTKGGPARVEHRGDAEDGGRRRHAPAPRSESRPSRPAPSDAPFDYFPSAEVVRIPLAQVRQVRTCPTILRRRALEEQEADFGREIDFEHKYSLDNFEFEDPTLETHSIRVTVTVERRQPFDFITYKEGSVLPDELLSAHRVALARLVLRLPPSNVIETEVAALRMTHGFDVAPGEADANDALLVADLELAVAAAWRRRFLRAALHDSRGVSERFRLLRTHKLTPERIVDACSADHFNHTDHRDDAADGSATARVARHQAQHWTPHAFHLPSERKRRDANRELLAKSRENFLRNHLTPFFQNPVGAPAGETPDSRLQTPKARLAFHPSTKGLERRDDASPADLAEADAQEAADLEAAEDAKTSDAAARLVASSAAPTASRRQSGSSSLAPRTSARRQRRAAAAVVEQQRALRGGDGLFVKDRDAAIAYSDIPPRRARRSRRRRLFARLLDAQADLLVELDELTSARFREDDPPIWVDMGQRQMGPHWVLSSVAADDARASPLLCALVERCISLGLSISRTGPSLPSPSKRARAAGDGRRRPRSQRRSSPGAGPALALLACSHLPGAAQASRHARDRRVECADEVDDFLLRDEFTRAEANASTRLAASNLREATRVIRQGEETAKAAHRKQRGGHHHGGARGRCTRFNASGKKAGVEPHKEKKPAKEKKAPKKEAPPSPKKKAKAPVAPVAVAPAPAPEPTPARGVKLPKAESPKKKKRRRSGQGRQGRSTRARGRVDARAGARDARGHGAAPPAATGGPSSTRRPTR